MPDIQQNRLNRRDALKYGLSSFAGLTGCSLLGNAAVSAAPAQRRPNVIIFHTDDQDFNTIGCYGAPVYTPHYDSLATSGVLFDRGYVTTGVCMASRYAMVTGQYPSRCNAPSFQKTFPKNIPTEPAFNTPLADGQPTFATVMKQAGYATGFVGKWNLGGDVGETAVMRDLPYPREWAQAWRPLDDDIDPSDPTVSDALSKHQEKMKERIRSFGFDYAASITTNPEGYRSRSLNYHNPEWITDGALRFIDENCDKPFFLYLNHTLHHIPHPQESLVVGDPRMTHGGYLDNLLDCMPPRQEIIEIVKKAGYPEETAYCTWLDMALGAVMNRLGEYGLSDDTMVIFISDNNVPAKGTIYEGGVNVPCMIRYPRMVPGGRRTRSLVQNIDFAPTIFECAGAVPSSGMKIDGTSLMPLLTGKRESIHDDLFFEIGWTRAVCTERWKYIALRFTENAEHIRTSKGGAYPWVYHGAALEPHQHHALLWHPAFLYPDQIYDLEADSSELVNLYDRAAQRRVLEEMKERLTQYLRTFDHPFGEFV